MATIEQIQNKPISQNPQRYTNNEREWVISASPDIAPVSLPIGVPLKNLKPLISADGIVVKVGENYLCSLITLNAIKNSNNPHYDIVQNGKVKGVVIGKTVKIIELDISRLESLADKNKIKGLKAGVSDIEYIFEGDKTDGISNNLIQQIDYTLTQLGERGTDKYSLYRLKLAPDEAYSIEALKTVSQDEKENNGLLDITKLKVFTEGVAKRLVLLREDFDMIKRMFFSGETPINDGKVFNTNQITDPLQRYSDLLDDNHQVIYRDASSGTNAIFNSNKPSGVISTITSSSVK